MEMTLSLWLVLSAFRSVMFNKGQVTLEQRNKVKEKDNVSCSGRSE